MPNSVTTTQFVVVILAGVFLCATAHPPWRTYKRHWSPRHHYHDHDHDHDHGRPDYDPYPPPTERCRYGRPCNDQGDRDHDRDSDLGCSCLLYVEYTLVFQKTKNDVYFPCNRRGLQSCISYCEDLFQDEGLRASSQQEACDVLGRDLHSSWYRKDQVCGSKGPYKDIPLEKNLCCKRGRSTTNTTVCDG